MIKYDIAVIGGGVSGVAAAVSAARRGRRVALIEQASFLSGMGTAGMITMVMTSRSWFYGIGRELINKLIAKGEAAGIAASLATEHSTDTLSVEAKEVQAALLGCGIPTV